MRIALAQINPTVGDIDGNAARIEAAINDAGEAGAALVVLPELAVSGYPPEDLLLKPHFLASCRNSVETIAARASGVVALVGFPEGSEAGCHNSLAVCADGEIAAIYRKVLLPNYGVFDEHRYFEPGTTPCLIDLDGVRIGLTICEDIWFPGAPTEQLGAAGAELIVNASASPYHRGKGTYREDLVKARVAETGSAMALCNLVGGQDELVFDGHSVFVGADGETTARAAQFIEEMLICDFEPHPRQVPAGAAIEPIVSLRSATATAADAETSVRIAEPLSDEAEVYWALKTGLGDYMAKNGFTEAVIALSGGIDSALVALLAVDVLGADKVSLVSMPSPHSSSGTREDAHAIAANLGARFWEISITAAMEEFGSMLAEPFGPDNEPGLAEENIQARIRGVVIMALSNKFGSIVLTTGNKSEMSVGYATLYGDMAGGFAVIKDVPKMLVYALVRYRNAEAGRELIPASAIDRPPSAELRADQRDTDSLPPYELLDQILEAYVERDLSLEEIVAAGVDREIAGRVLWLVDRSEYKRRQAPPGVKISPKAFGRDRRVPITNRFAG